MNRDQLNYRLMCKLLGAIEDKLGDCKETQELNARLDDCMDSGKSLSFLNTHMANRLDQLAEAANV